MAWYNDYRPTNFDEVVGQNLVKTVLQNALKLNKIKHGYLLSGPKGVGKTTIARIFAKELNNLDSNPQASMDVVELDAASNTGVDNIRQLIDSAQTPPFAGKYKIFIIDEVHMLSKSAMNALLKILEEPPVYLIFLLATTNPEKLLPTVLSRLTKLTLSSHTIEDIFSQLKSISSKEKMIIDDESLQLIAKRANGGQRDAINLLETLYSYELENFTIKETSNLLGLVSSEIFDRVSNTLLSQDFRQIKNIIQEIENTGLDGEGFLAQYLDYLLESVFSNPSATQSLILPVAGILDMKLPINTVHSSFALIQAQITKVNLPKITVIENPKTILKNLPIEELTEKKTEKLIEILENEPKTVESDIIDNSEQINDEFEFQSLTNSVKEENNILNTEVIESNFDSDILPVDGETLENATVNNLFESDLKKYLSEMLTLKNCPPPLKIVSNDINIESIKENQITISISSPIFLPQIKNEKATKFIIDVLLEKTKILYSLEIILRDPSLKNVSSKANSAPRQKENNMLSLDNEHTETPPIVNKEKIFYKIYGDSMPPNNASDLSQIQFYSQAITLPKKKEVATNSQDWNSEIGNIFEF